MLMPRPIQTMISMVTAIEAVIRSAHWREHREEEGQGQGADQGEQHLPLVAVVPATVSPRMASIAASRTGRARANMLLSSCTQTSPSAAMPAANTQSPK